MAKIVDRYPHEHVYRDLSHRRWRVNYDLAYDGGGSEWTGWYLWKWQARAAIFFNMNITSWGGSATLIDMKE